MIAVLGPTVNAEMGPTSEKFVKNAKLKDCGLNILTLSFRSSAKRNGSYLTSPEDEDASP
jgi:hypothetical protein